MKKRIVDSIVLIIILLIGIQIYAAGVLNSNIFTLVSNGIDSIKNNYIQISDQQSNALLETKKADISSFITTKNKEINSTLQQHVTIEQNRANSELEAYMDTLKQDFNNSSTQAISKAKIEITTSINTNINNYKSLIEQEFEKQIQQQIKK